VVQISQLVSANESLKLENAILTAQNEQLRGQLLEIGAALGRFGGGTRRGRGRQGAEIPGVAPAKPKRTRRPITDPEVLAKRSAALAKARAARTEKLAAARIEGNGASNPGEG
jgi:hypothetical protein